MPSIELLDKYIIDRRRGLPLHAQLQQALRKLLDENFNDGDAFFTETELLDRFGVSRATVRQAMGELSREGLLLRRPSIGTVVTKANQKTNNSSTTRGNKTVSAESVGVFVPDYQSEFASLLLQNVVEQCRTKGVTVCTYYTHRGQDLRQAYLQISRPPEEERFIFLYGSIELYDALHDSGYRTVALESPAAEYGGLVVETDAGMAVQIGVDYLKSLGHRNIALLVNEPAESRSVQLKIDRFAQIVPAGKLVMCGTQNWENSYDAAYSHMAELWDGKPSAVMTTSDPGAWAALRWFAENDVRVPQDVSVLGFEDAKSSRFMNPALSTIAHPYFELARRAVETLWQDHVDIRHQALVPKLIVRATTGHVS